MNQRLFPVPINVFTLKRDQERKRERDTGGPRTQPKQELIRCL